MKIEYREGLKVLHFENDDDATAFAIFLREIRAQRGYTVAEMAAKLGYSSKASYWKFEKGDASPSLRSCEKVIRALVPGAKITLKIAA